MSTLLLILGLFIALSLHFTVNGQIGVNYGTDGRGLPPPSQVVALFKRYGIQRMKIYDTYNPEILKALSGSGIELAVGIQNRDLQYVAANAEAWVRDNIQKYPDVKFRHIVVGNEVSPINRETSQYVRFVLPAMQNIYNAICAVCLGDVKVTTTISMEVLSKSYPPQEGEFRSDVAPYLNPIIRFLMETEATLFANIYPYFAYINNPQQINIRYALLDPGFEGVMAGGVRYQNLFVAMVDAVNAALEKSAASMSFINDDGTIIDSVIAAGGESHWPSAGNGRITTNKIAEFYTNNLVQAVKKGTPKRPGEAIETYIFAMFDEDLKPGAETEKHFGLFYPNGQPKYPVNYN